MDDPRIPASPPRNDAQASCLGQGNVEQAMEQRGRAAVNPKYQGVNHECLRGLGRAEAVFSVL
eukprot:9484633-Pyramimonas_sp.AAC.1